MSEGYKVPDIFLYFIRLWANNTMDFFKIYPAIHREIGINCLSPIGRSFERLFVCFMINKLGREKKLNCSLFELSFEKPPLDANFFDNIELSQGLITHKIYVLDDIFYIMRNF